MHLHSFTYDFHLRSICSYVAGNSQLSLKHGYHLTNFLDDFNKYYTKAPNYARNLIHSGEFKIVEKSNEDNYDNNNESAFLTSESGEVVVNNLAIQSHTLYQFLLKNAKNYGMEVFFMSEEEELTKRSDDHESLDASAQICKAEYVLVRLSTTPILSYHDGTRDTHHADDFNVTLIVTWPEQFSTEPNDNVHHINLKYYLMLTSKNEVYPKRDVESNNKIGKFRTVYSVVKSIASSSQLESPSEMSPISNLSPYLSRNSKSDVFSNAKDTQVDFVMPLYFNLFYIILSINMVGIKLFSHFQNLRKIESASSLKDYYENDGTVIAHKSADLVEEACVMGKMAPTPPPVPDCPLATANVNYCMTAPVNIRQIRQESINYLGYYSSHEQLMQQVIMEQAATAQKHINAMVAQGARDCRTHLLWNRLLETRSLMTYAEFTELKDLACEEPLVKLDPRLSPLVNQPISWYQALAKLLQNRYQEYYKHFSSSDGNINYHIVLHPNYVQAFMMLSVDLHTSRGVSNFCYF